MKYPLTLFIAVLLTACSSPGSRYGHSREPVDLGGGQFLVEGYKLETGLERAREHCGTRAAVTKNIMRPVRDFEWTKIIFACE